MRVNLAFWICCGAVLVLACLVHCKRGKRARCDQTTSNTTYHVKARQLARRKGFKVACKQNEVIAHLEVAGHKGTCQGLTPDLFVQVNMCLWKKNCTLRYKKKRGKYMLKVLAGPKPDCAITEAERFTISYECALADEMDHGDIQNASDKALNEEKKQTPEALKLLDIMSEEPASDFDGEASLDRAEPTVQRGIIRSHKDFPWQYTPTLGDYNRHYKLILLKPSGASKFFAYTIRSLKVSHGDSLVVTGADGEQDVFSTHVTNSTVVTDGSSDVTFSLHTTTESPGGEGFFICFQWQNSSSASDVCKSVIRPQYCNRKNRSKPRRRGNNKGKKGRNGKKKNRRRNNQGGNGQTD